MWGKLISGDINEACKNVTDTIISVAESNIPNKVITYRRKDAQVYLGKLWKNVCSNMFTISFMKIIY
jgi:hypothetical protein